MPNSSAIRRALTVTSALALAAVATFATAASASAETAPPAYFPDGPQTNVNQDALEGWTLCYSGLYNEEEIPLEGEGGILSELCTGEYLLLAGGPVDDPQLTVLAAAARADALFVTPADGVTTHEANGSGWYFDEYEAWGFALAGTPVIKDSCDVEETDAEFRLCWHLMGGEETGNQLDGGYRAGAVDELNGSNEYTRYIYQANGTEIVVPAAEPQLADTGVDSTTPILVAGGMLVLGLVVFGVSRRRATN